jgi:hypothetical protein
LEVGVITRLEELLLLLHVYVPAPVTEIVAEAPEQTVAESAVRVGSTFTVMLPIAGEADTQPRELVPVTEYTVLTAGFTTAPPFRKV